MKIDRRLQPSVYLFSILLLAAIFCNVLANRHPLYCRIDGQTFYPALRQMWTQRPLIFYGNERIDSLELNQTWRQYPHYEAVLFAPVPFSPGEQDGIGARPPGTLANGEVRSFHHWLGTDKGGRDVLAGMIAGARIALLTGLVAMGIAFFIGLALGSLAGFWGDDRLRIRRGQFWLTLLALPLAWFYAFIAGPDGIHSTAQWGKNLLVFGGIILVSSLLGKLISRLPYLSRQIIIPADLLVMRSAEIFNALPKFIFLLIVAGLLDGTQTIWLMVALIGVFNWPDVAGLLRAELLRVRSLDFVMAARALGLPEWRVLFHHVLPNALRAVYTLVAIGVGSAILLEAALSFLGLSGSDMEGASWGMLLNSAREAREAWWLALPPGLAICVTVLALNKVGEVLSERKA